MRILFVISDLTLGGAQRQIALLSQEFVRLGHQVSIYLLNRESPLLGEVARGGVEVLVDQKLQRLDLGVLRRLRRHIQTWRPHVVHGFLYDGDIYSRLAALGCGLPVLNSERNHDYALSFLQRLGYRLTARLCDGVVANSYAGGEFARLLHRLQPERVHVVWNGIDLQQVDVRIATSQRPARQIFAGEALKRLCVVGAIKPQKDYPLALRTMRQLVDRDPAWRMICVGDELAGKPPGHKAEVLAELRRLRLEHFVRFVGNRRDVVELIASSDLLLITSLHEGFPNVLLEAMACGTAVVSTDYSDVRRILQDPEQIVGSRDAQRIAAAVVRCFARRAELATEQRRWVEQHATASASAAAMLAIYAKYAAPDRRATASMLGRNVTKPRLRTSLKRFGPIRSSSKGQ